MAEVVVVDERSRRVSAINLLDSISTVGFPVVVPRIVVLVRVDRDDDTDHVQAEATVAVNDRVLATSAVQIDFDGRSQARVIMDMSTVAIPEAGVFRVTFRVPNAAISCDMDVLAMPPPPPQLTITPTPGDLGR